MVHLLILLFYLFHYGRTEVFEVVGTLPLLVRSPNLNCWSLSGYGDPEDNATYTKVVVTTMCDNSNWTFLDDVCYFLTWTNTKFTGF